MGNLSTEKKRSKFIAPKLPIEEKKVTEVIKKVVEESDDEKDIDLNEGVDKGLLVNPDIDAFGVTENPGVSL